MAEVIKAEGHKISRAEAKAAGITTTSDGIVLTDDNLVVASNPPPTLNQDDAAWFVADRALHLTRDDKVVEEDDPSGVKVLVGKGGRLSLEDAEKYGLKKTKDKAKEDEWVKEKEPEEDLGSLKKDALLELAEEKGVEAKPSMTKAEIIDAIEAGQE